ncbi:MAG: MFS transporter [Actinobacteria bacterium]|nr:MFS transporter [Actinomycetota bacterium]
MGESEGTPPPFRQTLKETGASWYPLIALGTLALVDRFQGVALQTLGPEIARGLGISKGAIAGLVAVKFLAIFVAALPMAAYVQNRPHRHLVALATAFVWGIATLFTGFVTGLIGLAVVLIIDGMSTGSIESIHKPLVMDSYPPSVRVRALSFHESANLLTGLIGPLLVAALAGLLYFSWRGTFLIMGAISLGAALIAVRLKDPGFNLQRWKKKPGSDSSRSSAGSF